MNFAVQCEANGCTSRRRQEAARCRVGRMLPLKCDLSCRASAGSDEFP